MAVYLYGFVRNPGGEVELGGGVGSPPQPLRLLRFHDVAAIISDVPEFETESEGRALRRDMKAHNDVVSRALALGTVLPLAFGTVAQDEDSVVSDILAPRYDQLAGLLERFDGTVEVSLKVRREEDAAVRSVLEADPDLRAWSREIEGSSYEDRISFGQAIASAIKAEREERVERVIEKLRPLARDVLLNETKSELELLNASFLLDETALAAFDRAVEEMGADAGGPLQIDYVGPLPIYSFARLNWSAGEGGAAWAS